VYDRVECLEQCIRSVQGLRFEAREHIIVADAPPSPVVAELQALVKALDDGRHPLRLAVSRRRANDWGISPASIGLSLAAGEYACFLSDDNGYTPDHFEKLVTALESDPELGFAYSGCLYDGRMTLNSAPPAFSRIDLGQPLFRKELFDRYLGGALPFTQSAWDWEMIRLFIQNGVRWKHVSDATFIFRLAKYSHLTPAVTDRSGSGTP
jgi:GT2 family glycosyltransferase